MKYIYIIEKHCLEGLDLPENIYLENVGSQLSMYKNLIKIISEEELLLESNKLYRKLEIKSFCENNKDLDNLRTKYLEFKLDYKNIKQEKHHNIEDNRCLISFYIKDEILLVKEDEYFKIIKELSKFQLGDIYLSSDPANNKINRENVEGENIIDLEGFLYIKKANNKQEIREIEKVEKCHLAKDKDKINLYLNLPNHLYSDIFVYDSLHDKENILRVENNIFPQHLLMKENKLALAKYLLRHSLHLNNKQMNKYLSHNSIPYTSQENLIDNLKKYYKEDTKRYRTSYFEDVNQACAMAMYLSEKDDDWIMVKERGTHIIYHHVPPKKVNIDECKKKIINHYYGNRKTNLINLSLKELLNLHKQGNCIFIQDEKNPYIITKANEPIPLEKIININNDHLGYHGKEDFIKGLMPVKKIIKPFYFPAQFQAQFANHDMLDIEAKFEGQTHHLCSDFFLGDYDHNYLLQKLNQLWIQGVFITEFGKDYYHKFNRLLPETVKFPVWLKPSDERKIEEVMIFLSQF